MVEHILLMRWKEQASQDATERVMEGLRGFKEKIPGIVDLTCGVNFSPRARGYTHALCIRFRDRAALDAYFPHAEHQRVVHELMDPISEEVLILDYEY